jgi:adenine-specific DNA-methyltransferase
MASQTRTYDQKKLLGQIYTPPHIVQKILNDSGFYASDLDQIQVLDPACGDGRFLVPIAEYIIENSDESNLEKRLKSLNGWDIDPDAIEICRKNLDNLILPFGIKMAWKLHVLDALCQIKRPQKFDFILGNPPYIRLQHLSNTQRAYIKDNYSFCQSGSTDAYIAFFQLASQLLGKKGVCGFVTPNSFLSSETALSLRRYFTDQQNLIQITNYKSVRIFGNTGTYAAITIFGKRVLNHFKFETTDHQYIYNSREIPFSELENDAKWNLSTHTTNQPDGTRLGDVCRISVGITTLADRFYIFSVLEKDGDYVKVKSKNGTVLWLENGILKPIIKGSKLKSGNDPVTEYILFPYIKDQWGKHRIIPEENLKTNYPKTYQYLTEIKETLLKRDNGKSNPVAWYAFGRSQGLDSSFGKKIIFSPMNLFPNFVLYENPDCTVYSGYFIKYDGDYEALLAQLNSQRMADFIATAGRDFQGGYKGYNKKIVENFVVTSIWQPGN